MTATDIGRSAPTIACRAPRSSTNPPSSGSINNDGNVSLSRRPGETHTGPAIISGRLGRPRDAMEGRRQRRSKSGTAIVPPAMYEVHCCHMPLTVNSVGLVRCPLCLIDMDLHTLLLRRRCSEVADQNWPTGKPNDPYLQACKSLR
ncbi:hypothetical protein LX36DRAFT_364055 [Colletotrichum falcatum]|nr:hypothetical protein LX36DRAFT_364055 [Colletotrichum falcatum]